MSERIKLRYNRSVMPLDVWGRRRATMKASTCVLSLPERVRETAEPPSCQGSGLAILACERGIPSKHESPVCVDQVPVLYTHTARRYSRLEGGTQIAPWVCLARLRPR